MPAGCQADSAGGRTVLYGDRPAVVEADASALGTRPPAGLGSSHHRARPSPGDPHAVRTFPSSASQQWAASSVGRRLGPARFERAGVRGGRQPSGRRWWSLGRRSWRSARGPTSGWSWGLERWGIGPWGVQPSRFRPAGARQGTRGPRRECRAVAGRVRAACEPGRPWWPIRFTRRPAPRRSAARRTGERSASAGAARRSPSARAAAATISTAPPVQRWGCAGAARARALDRRGSVERPGQARRDGAA